MSGKTIRIYLVDGRANGVLTAEIISRWTGKVFAAPRTQLSDLAKRDEVKRTGIYCLVGQDPEKPFLDKVYIGEADKVITRLTIHDNEESKDFWTRTLVVISKDENLGKSHGRYLESRLIQMADLAGRATLDNGTAPPLPHLPEADVDDMEFFLEQIQMVFPVLGFTFLQPRPTIEHVSGNVGSPTFVMTDVETNASAKEINGEFVVLKGSTARKEAAASWTTYRPLRDQLLTEGKLIQSDNPDFLILNENVAFSSPSAAASVIAAASRNGWKTWSIKETKQSYGQWREERLKKAQAASN